MSVHTLWPSPPEVCAGGLGVRQGHSKVSGAGSERERERVGGRGARGWEAGGRVSGFVSPLVALSCRRSTPPESGGGERERNILLGIFCYVSSTLLLTGEEIMCRCR